MRGSVVYPTGGRPYVPAEAKLPWLDAVCVVMPQLPYLTQKIVKPPYGGTNLTLGFCYAASEAIFHLSEDTLEPWWVRFGPKYSQTHWFLRHPDGKVLDVTASQFDDGQLYGIYEAARRRAFGTPYPSKRARLILERIGRKHYFMRTFNTGGGLKEFTPQGHPGWF